MIQHISFSLIFFLLLGCKNIPCDNGNPRNGLYTSFYSQSKLRIEYQTKDCFGHGYYKKYYPNGNLEVLGQYEYGELQDSMIYFDSDGKQCGTYSLSLNSVVFREENGRAISYNYIERVLLSEDKSGKRKKIHLISYDNFFDDNFYGYKLFKLDSSNYMLLNDLSFLVFNSDFSRMTFSNLSLNVQDKIWKVVLCNDELELTVWTNGENKKIVVNIN